jgi:20S proteasome subunit beta 6
MLSKNILYLRLNGVFFLKIGHKNRYDPKVPLTVDEAIAIVKDVFVIATERDIHTGDCVEIKVIMKDGVRTELFSLKKD